MQSEPAPDEAAWPGPITGTGAAGRPGGVVDPDAYRRVAGRFATGVAVVTTHADGVDYAITVNAFTSVSLDPVRVLFCAETVARFHDAVLRSGLWAVSVLSRDGKAASSWFAKRGRPLAGQLAHWDHETGAHTGAAILVDAIAAMECRTAAVYGGGDHSIVLGDVLDVSVPNPDGEPLIYYEGVYTALGETG